MQNAASTVDRKESRVRSSSSVMSRADRWKLVVLFLAGAVALFLHGPLFVRAPLGPDPVMYDVQARTVANGGMLYRDVVEPNLPGAVWLHLAVRSIGGWSSEALRIADLFLFCLTALLASSFILPSRRDGTRPTATLMVAGLMATLLVGAYSTLSEWCHCQRDVWMLVFLLTAMRLRISRFELLSRNPKAAGLWRRSFLEGAVWGAAVWLKPHAVIASVAAFLVSWAWAVYGWRSRDGEQRLPWRKVLKDFSGVLVGAMIVGAIGIAWLIQSGTWPYLWTMLTQWNPEYLKSAAARWTWPRFAGMQSRLLPWSFIHLAAIPIAAVTLWKVFISLLQRRMPMCGLSQAVASAVYIAWVAQALLLQHLLDYVYVPTMVLGATVVAASMRRAVATIEWRPLLVTGVTGLCVVLPAVCHLDQIPHWRECVTAPRSPALSDELARLPVPDWNALAQVREFLHHENVADGELTAYHTHTIHLYPWLEVQPSTRFVYTETNLRVFPSHAVEIEYALDKSKQRFVVTNLLEAGVDPRQLQDSTHDWKQDVPEEALNRFPFNQPVVFRAGPYLVHQAGGSSGPMETRFFPLAAKSAGL